jgi:Kef-type K+ transport system membrane component KefB
VFVSSRLAGHDALLLVSSVLFLQGIFVGALLSMSSTSVVVKCLESFRMNGTAFGQITIGTLILQVRTLGRCHFSQSFCVCAG